MGRRATTAGPAEKSVIVSRGTGLPAMEWQRSVRIRIGDVNAALTPEPGGELFAFAVLGVPADADADGEGPKGRPTVV